MSIPWHAQEAKSRARQQGWRQQRRQGKVNCCLFGHWAKDCRKHTSLELMRNPRSSWRVSASTWWCWRLCTFKSHTHTMTWSTLMGCYHDTSMTGHAEVVSDLDQYVVGSVKFGDGSVVSIQGCGPVVFTGKHGAHKVVTGVYYILGLRNIIVSLGQLDQNGATTHINDGVLCIWDRQRQLLTKVRCGANRLYVLHLDDTRPTYLSTRQDADTWRWHDSFGHISFNALQRMSRHKNTRWCAGCQSSNMWTNSVTSASPPSIVAHPSPSRQLPSRRMPRPRPW